MAKGTGFLSPSTRNSTVVVAVCVIFLTCLLPFCGPLNAPVAAADTQAAPKTEEPQTEDNTTVRVPNFFGASREAASKLAQSVGLKIKVEEAGYPPVPALAHTISTQSLRRGTIVPKNTEITLGIYGIFKIDAADSLPSSPDCKAKPFSVPRWDKDYEELTCKCLAGYNEKDGKCVKNAQAVAPKPKTIPTQTESEGKTDNTAVMDNLAEMEVKKNPAADLPPATTPAAKPETAAAESPNTTASATDHLTPPEPVQQNLEKTPAQTPIETAAISAPPPPEPLPQASPKRAPKVPATPSVEPAPAATETTAPEQPAHHADCNGLGELIQINAQTLAAYGWSRYILPGPPDKQTWACACRPNFIANGIVTDKKEAKCLPAKVGRACQGGGKLKEVGVNFACECPDGTTEMPAGGWTIPMLPSCIKNSSYQ